MCAEQSRGKKIKKSQPAPVSTERLNAFMYVCYQCNYGAAQPQLSSLIVALLFRWVRTDGGVKQFHLFLF